MKYFTLGNTGIKVSALCFGTLPMGPLQADLSVEEGGKLILQGLKQGINFIDTAQMYGTNAHIKWALAHFSGEAVIATKSTASTYKDMKASIEESLNELNRDYIDIFHLHAARDNNPLVNREGALEALVEYKSKGLIKAIGLANHSVLGVESAVADSRIDVVFALINRTGIGILDGGAKEMVNALDRIKETGKGLYAMKAFGGGNLLDDIKVNLDFVQYDAKVPIVAVGMIRSCELEMNRLLFEGLPVPEELQEEARRYKKTAKVTFLCKGCNKCVELCHNDAISIIEGKAQINSEKCLLCGYCSRECPQFAIRVI